MIITIYCSGSIQKGANDTGKLCWSKIEKDELARGLLPNEVLFLNPDDPIAGLDDGEANFGRDLYQIQYADFIVVDARQRRGIGIGIEMLASRLLKTPLVVVAPRNSYYRSDEIEYRGSSVKNYVHPHVQGLADAVVDDFTSAGIWIKNYLSNPIIIKTEQTMWEAIEAYKNRILPLDTEMLKVQNSKENSL